MERVCSVAMLCFWVFFTLTGSHQAFGCLKEERHALLHVKAEFNISYGGNSLRSWNAMNSDDCCAWERIKCDNRTGRVIEIYLNETKPFESNVSNHSWYLSASLFLPFKELQSLNLSNNYLSGWAESDGFRILSNLKKLQLLDFGWNRFKSLSYISTLPSLKYLYFNNNEMEGPLPTEELMALSKLKRLRLRANHFNGSLPDKGLCEMKNLRELDLSRNRFNGNIPACLQNLVAIRLLDLSENNLEGTMPPFISNLTSLEYLSLSHNRFDGLISLPSLANHSKLAVFDLLSGNKNFEVETEDFRWIPSVQLKILRISNCTLNKGASAIPSFLSSQYDLRVVDLSNNGLKGTFPSSILDQNKRLEELTLANNFFEGAINLSPHHNYSYMKKLDISVNNIQGELPMNIGMLFPNLESLNAFRNALQGVIPPSIGQMRKLQTLDLSKNNFTGEVPEEIGMGCSFLWILKLSNNNLHGKIFPRQINLPGLALLELDNNHFIGTIGNSLANSSQLISLDVSNNSMSGKIPSWIGKFSMMVSLIMSGNSFEGFIPSSFCNMKDLSFLDLSHNNLSGMVHSCLFVSSLERLHLQGNNFIGFRPNGLSNSSSTHLVSLDVSYNKLSGHIPHWISTFSQLRILLLKGNQFQGSIPDQLCQLNKLRMMDLSHNNLEGLVPACLANISFGKLRDEDIELDIIGWWEMMSLLQTYEYKSKEYSITSHGDLNKQEEVEFVAKYRLEDYKGTVLHYMAGIDLSCNKLSGQVPSEIGALNGIHSLNLSHNLLSGSIPASFSNLEQVESIDLSYNKLSGEIPQELIKLKFLAVFSVSYNNLSGMIPYQNQFATFKETSYENNPLLCGAPLNKSCNSSVHVLLPSSEEDDDKGGLNEFLLSFFVSYIVGLWGFIFLVNYCHAWRVMCIKIIDACVSFILRL